MALRSDVGANRANGAKASADEILERAEFAVRGPAVGRKRLPLGEAAAWATGGRACARQRRQRQEEAQALRSSPAQGPAALH